MAARVAATLGLVALLAGCATTRSTPPTATPRHSLNRPAVGLASWYGRAFHGHATAFGGTYDSEALTCAHPTLPLGTRLRVTNLRNGRSVVVRVTDRGPHVRGRIVDLSHAAAKALDMVGDGLVPVEVVVLSDGG